ncbi:DNA gyrase subunit B [Pyxidicoccus parkwayensis]|uniref:DNA topoisomerase (ATP-hydrolyzing) n=2 Tax=Pyxidicoccus parkwayensis TaxID=2813578 RepID=A0ABX7PBQ8_9BACT|nr:DNA gyrase subunit B [Pyxidicoccus parkwaysis]
MYIGGTDALGLHHLAFFILDAIYADARRGACRDFTLEVGAEGAVSVFSTGRFAPPAELAEVARGLGMGQRTPLGPEWGPGSMLRDLGWGMQMPVSLALSSRYEVDTWDGARQWHLSGVDGSSSGEPREVQPAEPLPVTADSGIRIRLIPDATIFKVTTFDAELLTRRCRELTFLVPGLRARFTDHRTGQSTLLHYAGGVAERLLELTADVPCLHPEPLAFDVQWEGFRVRCALQWCEAGGSLWSYANTVRTRRDGAHVDGVFQALQETLSALSGEPVPSFSREMLEGGLRAIVAADGAEERMTFAGPTKDLLAIEGLAQAVAGQLRPALVETLRGHPLTRWLVAHGRVRPRPAVVTRPRSRD